MVVEASAGPVFRRLGERIRTLTRQGQKVLDRTTSRLADFVPASVRSYAEPVQGRLRRLWGEVHQRTKPLRRLSDNGVERWRQRLGSGLSDVAHRLNVPTRTEIDGLRRRVTDLERRLNALGRGTDEAA